MVLIVCICVSVSEDRYLSLLFLFLILVRLCLIPHHAFRYSAAAISKAAEEEEARMVVLAAGGLEPMVQMLAQSDQAMLMEGITGAIWKCAKSYECKEALINAKVMMSTSTLEIERLGSAQTRG